MLMELVKKSRSYRGYNENRKISEEELKELVEYTRFCPSSVNGQALKYRLVWEPDEVAAVLPLTYWAKALPQITLPHPHMGPTAFIVICQDTQLDASPTRYQRDTGIVAQTMLLAATERGLGGCMIGSFSAGAVKEVLGLGEHLRPMLVVAFGEPMETIVLTEIDEGESIKYYRDENDVHYVPKRKLKDIILTPGK